MNRSEPEQDDVFHVFRVKLSSCWVGGSPGMAIVSRGLRGVCRVWVHTFVVIIVVIHTIETGGGGGLFLGEVNGPDVMVSSAAVRRLDYSSHI